MNINFLKNKLQNFAMLEHDFYKKLWNEGKLSNEDIAYYASQYYFIEENFLSSIVKAASSAQGDVKKILNENIIDETGYGNEEGSHLNLWLKFCAFFGLSKDNIINNGLSEVTKNVIHTFANLSCKSIPSALGAMYGYEHQSSDVAKSKIYTSIEHYGISESSDALNFFKAHSKADIWHTEQIESIVEKFTPNEFVEFSEAASLSAKSLLEFLDGIMHNRKLSCA